VIVDVVLVVLLVR